MNSTMEHAPKHVPMQHQPPFAAPHVAWWWVALPSLATLAAAAWTALTGFQGLDPVAARWMAAWFFLSVTGSVLARRHLVPGFLLGLFMLLSGWRLAGPLGIDIISIPAGLTLLAYLARLIDVIHCDLTEGGQHLLTPAQWQLSVLRVYVAFDMVPHFTEKLFAGPGPFHADSLILAHYGMSHPDLFVLMGGLCELAVAIGLGLGLFTRLAAAGAVLYYVSTSLIGHHFSRGFIWNLNGGGWEYPMLMIVVFGGFIFTGAGRFSLDQVLARAGIMPRKLQCLGLAAAQRPAL